MHWYLVHECDCLHEYPLYQMHSYIRPWSLMRIYTVLHVHIWLQCLSINVLVNGINYMQMVLLVFSAKCIAILLYPPGRKSEDTMDLMSSCCVRHHICRHFHDRGASQIHIEYFSQASQMHRCLVKCMSHITMTTVKSLSLELSPFVLFSFVRNTTLYFHNFKVWGAVIGEVAI